MSSTKKIIIIDDDDMLRDTLKEQFSLHDEFVVSDASTATAGVKAVKNDHADLVILDVNLPDMDGYSVCRALRHVDKKVPIVFVTAKGDLKDYTAGREAGGDSYLVKPIARAALRSIVNLFTSIERARRPDFGA